jgi:uncharacterized membrane protein
MGARIRSFPENLQSRDFARGVFVSTILLVIGVFLAVVYPENGGFRPMGLEIFLVHLSLNPPLFFLLLLVSWASSG